MTLSRLSTTGTDVYQGIGFTTSSDGGETWKELTDLPYTAKPLRDGIMGMFGAMVPVLHPQTGKVLLLGNCVGYTNYGKPGVKLTGVRYPAFAVFDPATQKWSPDYTVLDREENANTTSGIPWIQPDGTLLWPCNGGQVLKAAFDGEKITILARSPQIEGLGKQPKNTGEYHLTKMGSRFYLAMRCPDQNRIAVSTDGQKFEPAVELRWDDGSLVPSVATQMRWVRQQGKLYLVYTRENEDGKGVFRHRAPLWMAELDTKTVRLKKATEVVVVPVSPGRDDLGNFGTTFVTDELSFITTSEFGRTKNSNSRVYITRITATAEKWEKEIAAFETKDKETPPAKGGIVFVGSSSIRMWSTLEQDFPKHRVLNRGFGGSQISDSVQFADRIVIPYAPRMVVMYAGGNDLNAGESPEQIFADFQAFEKKVHAALPDTEIAFISSAPNPSRWAQVENVKALNKSVADFCAKTPKTKFIDVFPHMLGPEGLPKPDIFREDRLHMVDKGYRIWTEVVGKQLPAADK